MTKKSILRLLVGIISSLVLMALLFYFFIFLNPFRIHESNTLKWIPILIAVVSLYVSGIVNKDTPVKLLVFLFLPYVIFQLFNFAYLPFIFLLLIIGILILVVTRNKQKPKLKWMAWSGIMGIFITHLFMQPLILEKAGFGYDDTGALKNVSILWDFTEKKELKLPSHVLLDQNGGEFDLINIKEKIHLVTFWATWCAPCMRDKPALEKLKRNAQNNSTVAFVDISFDNSDNVEWIDYLRTKKPLGLQLIAPSQKATSNALHFAGLPMYFIVQVDGSYSSYRTFDVVQKVLTKTLK